MLKPTRERVLNHLLANPRSTVVDLADVVGIDPISVRHHINSLLAEKLIIKELVRHGVGRPRQVYSLSETGQELFPTRYYQFTVSLLEKLKDKLPQETVGSLLSEMADDMASHPSRLANAKPMKERLEILKQHLEGEGFQIEIEDDEEHFLIKELSCPYYQISLNHPEICHLDNTVISKVLQTPIEKISCVLSGDNYCTYIVSKNQRGNNDS